jgi:hypothetical protein
MVVKDLNKEPLSPQELLHIRNGFDLKIWEVNVYF